MYEFQRVTLDKSDYQHNKWIRTEISGMGVWLKILESKSLALHDECGHMGGNLKITDSEHFVCKVHGWTYKNDGKNLNPGSPGLRKVRILEEDNYKMVVLIPSKQKKNNSNLAKDLLIKVHSHACITLEYLDTRLLFDPWLFGTTYYGSWQLHPDPVFDLADLNPTAIIITHPHPDHFHLETLKRINPNLPIYFPGFPSKFIENGLADINWRNINLVGWGEKIGIGDYLSFEFLRPRSMWEDSAILTTLQDRAASFNWLNLVDAGSVIDEFALPDLDLLSSAFDQGASGFPLTWDHIEKDKKLRILEEQKKQTLSLLPARSKRLSAKYFLPFAGHWRLGLPEHKDYAESIPHTQFDEIIDAFAFSAASTEVIAIKPGSQFNFFDKKTSRIEVTESPIFDSQDTSFFKSSTNFSLEDSLVKNFEKRMYLLQTSSSAFNVEPVNFKVRIPEIEYEKTFTVPDSMESQRNPISVSVEIPKNIFELYSKGLANWDHISIGYWGKWDRKPNIYPSNFMRLLQSGDATEYSVKGDSIGANEMELLASSVGDLIEKNPSAVSLVLNRAGLPCISCSHSNAEKLSDAFAIHNVDLDANPWILKELMAVNRIT